MPRRSTTADHATVTALPRYKKDQQAAAELANALMELPDEYVMCRDIRHAWGILEDFHVTDGGKRVQEVKRILECERCHAVQRHEVYHLTRSGLEKVSQHYRYIHDQEDGGIPYQIKGVPRGVKPASIVQGEQYRRVLERVATNARRQRA